MPKQPEAFILPDPPNSSKNKKQTLKEPDARIGEIPCIIGFVARGDGPKRKERQTRTRRTLGFENLAFFVGR